MRVCLVHGPAADVRTLRQVLVGAGLECARDDCVPWEQLAVRLAQRDVDLIVVKIEDDAAVDWDALREVDGLTRAPKLAIGPRCNGEAAGTANLPGVLERVDEADLPLGLDRALDRLRDAGAIPRPRGTVVSVVAPTAGSGGTVAAANLAASLAKGKSTKVALIELCHQSGDLGLLLNLKSDYCLRDVCRRWRALDAVAFKSSFTAHDSGLNVLTQRAEDASESCLSAEAVRRIAVLARVTFDRCVMALQSRVGEEEIEVMRMSDAVVLVVRPDVPAVRRARAAYQKALDAGVARQRLHLVVNRWGQSGQLKLQQIESTMGLKALQLIPEDPGRVNQAVNEGRLLRELSSSAKITRRFATLAAEVEKLSDDESHP